MRATSIIYRRELGAYMRSPLSWVIAAVLLLVQGILFYSFAMGGDQLSAYVLERFFYLSSGISIAAGLLLSFRLISEERQTHSMVLLTTSPVRDTEIIAAKFLAALTYLAVLLLLSLYIPMLIKVNGKITMSQVMVGYLGLFLLGGTVLSIGLFASSLAKSQLIVAILATAMVIVMVVLYPLAKAMEPPVQGVFQQLDLWWIHFQQGFMRGVLNLKDVIFYLGVSYFFLLLATKTLEAKRWQ
jgi:ABC-2 type transport system permease protein